jgi:hypothetical protein
MLYFRCGQMSVRRESANVLRIIAGIRDSAVQLVSILGSVVTVRVASSRVSAQRVGEG